MAPLAPQPLAASASYLRRRVPLAGGRATTVHVARFDRARVRSRVALLPAPQTLLAWCAERGVSDAIVGGFFTRPDTVPLGELWIDGVRQGSAPFDSPWDSLRSCVHLDGASARILPRWALGPAPAGHVLQAGPLLVRHGVPVARDGADSEGFSAAAHQFDSDITRGRYPRAALGISARELIAVACDGRASADAGLTLPELAAVLADLGADEAINLDGGGSTSLVFSGRLRNRPREEHGVPLPAGRPIATAIVFERL